jgi:hypothetical protein
MPAQQQQQQQQLWALQGLLSQQQQQQQQQQQHAPGLQWALGTTSAPALPPPADSTGLSALSPQQQLQMQQQALLHAGGLPAGLWGPPAFGASLALRPWLALPLGVRPQAGGTPAAAIAAAAAAITQAPAGAAVPASMPPLPVVLGFNPMQLLMAGAGAALLHGTPPAAAPGVANGAAAGGSNQFGHRRHGGRSEQTDSCRT